MRPCCNMAEKECRYLHRTDLATVDLLKLRERVKFLEGTLAEFGMTIEAALDPEDDRTNIPRNILRKL